MERYYGEVNRLPQKNEQQLEQENIREIKAHWTRRAVRYDELADYKFRETAKTPKAQTRLRKIYLRGILATTIAINVFNIGTWGYRIHKERVQYQNTRYSVTKAEKDGKQMYKHADPETNQIIEYLCGKNKLTTENRKKIARLAITKYIVERGGTTATLPSNLSQMTENDFLVWAENCLATFQHPDQVRITDERDGTRKKDIVKLELSSEKWFRFIPEKLPRNDKLYEAMWAIEKEAGNPQIRWMENSEWINVRKYRAYYTNSTNTMYIEPLSIYIDQDFTLEDFIAESSHGKQWQEDHLVSSLRSFKDDLITLGESKIEDKSYSEAQENQYHTPGTIEHEAHTEIEPKLKQEFEKKLGRSLKKKQG